MRVKRSGVYPYSSPVIDARPKFVFFLADTTRTMERSIYACFVGSGSVFLDFLLNGFRILFFTLIRGSVLLAIGVLGAYR